MMYSLIRRFLLVIVMMASPAAAETGLAVQNIAPGTYAIAGPLGQRDADNLGNNATFGLVVTDDGAVLIDAGGSYQGAAALDAVIRNITDQPVRYVINTGGQDHRWLGNGYWRERGAQIIASNAAVADHKARASLQLTILSNLIGSAALAGTEPAFADITFDDRHDLTLGGVTLTLTHAGGAHTPGDSFVWHGAAQTVFVGDIVYVGRILGVIEVSDTARWTDSFTAMAALSPAHIVPGHGPATDLATATRDTHDYLMNLRSQIAQHIEDGGDIIGSVDVDQSAFSYLQNFEGLARRNAQMAFTQMEWE